MDIKINDHYYVIKKMINFLINKNIDIFLKKYHSKNYYYSIISISLQEIYQIENNNFNNSLSIFLCHKINDKNKIKHE